MFTDQTLFGFLNCITNWINKGNMLLVQIMNDTAKRLFMNNVETTQSFTW